MALCCDFLSRRLSLHTDVEQRYTFAERYAELLQYHDASWINIWCATSAYYHALRGEAEEIPEIFSQHRLSTVNMLAPGKPMMEMIENQVYLAQGAYAKVVGRSAELLAVCEAMHYALVALHIRIQTAAAYEKLGKTEEARVWLRKALADAEPDGFVMPFVENYDCLQPILAREMKNDLTVKITDLGEAAKAFRSSREEYYRSRQNAQNTKKQGLNEDNINAQAAGVSGWFRQMFGKAETTPADEIRASAKKRYSACLLYTSPSPRDS